MRPLVHSSTILFQLLCRPHRFKQSRKMSVNDVFFWTLAFSQAPPLKTGFPKTPSSTSLFISLPRSADFIDVIIAKGPGCYLYKKNLKRSYREIPVDPKDYRFVGYRWRNLFYFDTVLSFGLRPANLTCQRTTNAISRIFRSAYHYEGVNYIDDFGGTVASH